MGKGRAEEEGREVYACVPCNMVPGWLGGSVANTGLTRPLAVPSEAGAEPARGVRFSTSCSMTSSVRAFTMASHPLPDLTSTSSQSHGRAASRSLEEARVIAEMAWRSVWSGAGAGSRLRITSGAAVVAVAWVGHG